MHLLMVEVTNPTITTGIIDIRTKIVDTRMDIIDNRMNTIDIRKDLIGVVSHTASSIQAVIIGTTGFYNYILIFILL